MKPQSEQLIFRKSAFAWVAAGALMLLLVPAIAMQFSGEVNWNGMDFLTMWILLSGTGSLFILASRKLHQNYRIPLAVLLSAALLYVWAELAVGVFTALGN